MKLVEDIFNNYYKGLLEKGDYKTYEDMMFSAYGIGNLYMHKIISFKDLKLKTYGQSGFAHFHSIDDVDIISITSGYLPYSNSSLDKVNLILGISEEDVVKYKEKSIESIKELGHDIFNNDNICLDNILNFRNIVTADKKISDFVEDLLFTLSTNYDDHLSENYYDPEEYNWNTEDIFWKRFKRFSGLRLDECGNSADLVNDLCADVNKYKIDRGTIFNIIKNNLKISDRDSIEFEDHSDYIEIKLLVDTNYFEKECNLILTDSDYVNYYFNDLNKINLDIILYKSRKKEV